MSGFPWTSLITAVVPAAAVLAGAALTGRQNNQAGQTAALKADYAALVQAVTALIERLADGPRPTGSRERSSAAPAGPRQLLSAVALARGVVDLAGSYDARRAAFDVWQAASRATDADERAAAGPGGGQERDHVVAYRKLGELRDALEGFLKAVRREVGGENRPGLKWMIQRVLRRSRGERPAWQNDDEP